VGKVGCWAWGSSWCSGSVLPVCGRVPLTVGCRSVDGQGLLESWSLAYGPSVWSLLT